MHRKPLSVEDWQRFAPGLPKLGHYECPKCGDIKVKDFFCFKCRLVMIRKPLKGVVQGYRIVDLDKPVKDTKYFYQRKLLTKPIDNEEDLMHKN